MGPIHFDLFYVEFASSYFCWLLPHCCVCCIGFYVPMSCGPFVINCLLNLVCQFLFCLKIAHCCACYIILGIPIWSDLSCLIVYWTWFCQFQIYLIVLWLCAQQMGSFNLAYSMLNLVCQFPSFWLMPTIVHVVLDFLCPWVVVPLWLIVYWTWLPVLLCLRVVHCCVCYIIFSIPICSDLPSLIVFLNLVLPVPILFEYILE